MARAARDLRALLQKALHDAVLERMEGDDDEPAAVAKHRLGGAERARQLLELAIDEDAERLKRARRRMDARRAGRAGRARDDLGEPRGAEDRLFCARPLDGAGDAPGLPLLAVDADDGGEVASGGLVHQRRGVGAASAHAHVERTVEAEGEAALRLVELHRGDADVEHDAVDRREVRPRGRARRDRRSCLRPASAGRRIPPPAPRRPRCAVGSRSMARTLPPRSRMARL